MELLADDDNSHDCSICKERKLGSIREFYIIQGATGQYAFDLQLAKSLVLDGRYAQPIPAEVLSGLIDVNAWTERHLDHVNPEVPGIFTYHLGGWILVDGIHRAVKSYRAGRNFLAYGLSFDEKQDCLLEAMKYLSPQQIVKEIAAQLKHCDRQSFLEVEVATPVPEKEEDMMRVYEDIIKRFDNRMRLILHKQRG